MKISVKVHISATLSTMCIRSTQINQPSSSDHSSSSESAGLLNSTQNLAYHAESTELLSNTIIILDVDSSSSVQYLKSLVQGKKGLPVKNLILTFNGQTLDSRKTLHSYGVYNGSHVTLSLQNEVSESRNTLSSVRDRTSSEQRAFSRIGSFSNVQKSLGKKPVRYVPINGRGKLAKKRLRQQWNMWYSSGVEVTATAPEGGAASTAEVGAGPEAFNPIIVHVLDVNQARHFLNEFATYVVLYNPVQPIWEIVRILSKCLGVNYVITSNQAAARVLLHNNDYSCAMVLPDRIVRYVDFLLVSEEEMRAFLRAVLNGRVVGPE